jgi:serine phosphatase RsbU (regulator of sigma subunit)
MVDPITVSEVVVELCQEQTLLLYTDGVPEAGRARARSVLAPETLSARVHGLALQDMLGEIETAAVDSAAGQPQDDIALLGLQLAGAGGGGVESGE